MAFENTSDFYVNPVLTETSIRYSNDANDFLAEEIFPVLPVSKKTGYIFKYDKSNLKTAGDLRAPSARANRVDYGMTKVTYGPLVKHALEIDIDEDIMEMYDSPLEPQVDATMAVTEMFELNKEAALASYLATTANLGASVTLSGTSQWGDFVNSAPFTDIETGVATVIKTAAKTPNTILMGYPVWSKLKNHPDMLDRVKFSQLGTMTESLLSDLVQIPNVKVAKAVYNSAADGQTDVMAFVWGKHCWIMYITSSPALRSVTAGYTLSNPAFRRVDSWYEIWNTTTFVRVQDFYQQFAIAAECMYGIINAVA
jgi:hypothetical protein